MAMLAPAVRALTRAPAWTLNYTRTVSDTVETLWLLDRRDHLRPVETALRTKALPADFRFPMMDLRLALARLCALDGRLDEADHWFAQARLVLAEQGAGPLRAITDFDQALMRIRAGTPVTGRRGRPVRPDRHDRMAPPGRRPGLDATAETGTRPRRDRLRARFGLYRWESS